MTTRIMSILCTIESSMPGTKLGLSKSLLKMSTYNNSIRIGTQYEQSEANDFVLCFEELSEAEEEKW